MKLNVFELLFFLVCIISVCVCSSEMMLSSSDYCLIKEYCNSKTKSCVKSRCEDEFDYKCGNDFCSSDKYTCDDIHAWSISLDKAKSLNLVEQQYRQFQEFFSKIQECPLKEYKWSPNDVCWNGSKCQSRSQIWSWIHVPKYTTCPCNKGKYKTKCFNGEFCAIDGDACAELKIRNLDISEIDFIESGIKKCHN